jgi:membrane-associated protease RseP (regulator of RpoE activity)
MEQLRRDLGEETEELKEARKKLLEAVEKRYKELAERAREEAERARKEAERAREALRERFERGPGGRMFPLPPIAGVASRGRLGIQVEPVPAALASHLQLKDNVGLIVTDVVKDSPADKAGVKPHDILLEMDGKPVGADVEAFRKAVRELKGEAKITLKVLREGKPVDLKDVVVPPGRSDDSSPGEFRMPGTVWLWSPEAEPMVERREVSTVMTVEGKQFTLKHAEGKHRLTVTGEVVDGKLKPTSITVREGKETRQYSSLDEVPEPLRGKVRKLLNSTRVATNDNRDRDDD